MTPTNFYVSNPDLHLIRSWSQELIGNLAKQTANIYRVSTELTSEVDTTEGASYSSFYGEITKQTDYRMYAWESVKCFVEPMQPELIHQKYGIDAKYGIILYLDTDYISDLADVTGYQSDLWVREGDFIEWEGIVYEVRYANRENRVFGLHSTYTQLRVEAITTRLEHSFVTNWYPLVEWTLGEGKDFEYLKDVSGSEIAAYGMKFETYVADPSLPGIADPRPLVVGDCTNYNGAVWRFWDIDFTDPEVLENMPDEQLDYYKADRLRDTTNIQVLDETDSVLLNHVDGLRNFESEFETCSNAIYTGTGLVPHAGAYAFHVHDGNTLYYFMERMKNDNNLFMGNYTPSNPFVVGIIPNDGYIGCRDGVCDLPTDLRYVPWRNETLNDREYRDPSSWKYLTPYSLPLSSGGGTITAPTSEISESWIDTWYRESPSEGGANRQAIYDYMKAKVMDPIVYLGVPYKSRLQRWKENRTWVQIFAHSSVEQSKLDGNGYPNISAEALKIFMKMLHFECSNHIAIGSIEQILTNSVAYVPPDIPNFSTYGTHWLPPYGPDYGSSLVAEAKNATTSIPPVDWTTAREVWHNGVSGKGSGGASYSWGRRPVAFTFSTDDGYWCNFPSNPLNRPPGHIRNLRGFIEAFFDPDTSNVEANGYGYGWYGYKFDIFVNGNRLLRDEGTDNPDRYIDATNLKSIVDGEAYDQHPAGKFQNKFDVGVHGYYHKRAVLRDVANVKKTTPDPLGYWIGENDDGDKVLRLYTYKELS